MRKEVDFSKGRQGRFAGMKIEVVDGVHKRNPGYFSMLALCVNKMKFDLIPGKIYGVSIDDDLVYTAIDESGDEIECPAKVFLPLKFEPQLEKKIRQLVIE